MYEKIGIVTSPVVDANNVSIGTRKTLLSRKEVNGEAIFSFVGRCLHTLGADEAKMYNCLIFRGRVGPNARLTASMQWMHAKINTRLECLLTSTSFRFHKRAQAQTKQEKERKRKVSLFIYWVYVEKACSERPIQWKRKPEIMQEASRVRADTEVRTV